MWKNCRLVCTCFKTDAFYFSKINKQIKKKNKSVDQLKVDWCLEIIYWLKVNFGNARDGRESQRKFGEPGLNMTSVFLLLLFRQRQTQGPDWPKFRSVYVCLFWVVVFFLVRRLSASSTTPTDTDRSTSRDTREGALRTEKLSDDAYLIVDWSALYFTASRMKVVAAVWLCFTTIWSMRFSSGWSAHAHTHTHTRVGGAGCQYVVSTIQPLFGTDAFDCYGCASWCSLHARSIYLGLRRFNRLTCRIGINGDLHVNAARQSSVSSGVLCLCLYN